MFFAVRQFGVWGCGGVMLLVLWRVGVLGGVVRRCLRFAFPKSDQTKKQKKKPSITILKLFRLLKLLPLVILLI